MKDGKTKKSYIKSNRFTEVMGWYGMIVILLSYFFVTSGVSSADSWAFQFMNLSGSVSLVILALSKSVIQSAILNGIWAVIAIYGLGRIIT